MVTDGMKIDKIAKYLKVSTETVQEWIDENLSMIH